MTWPSGIHRFEIALGDSAYPHLLAQSTDPPKRLYGLGDPDALVPALGAVGARRATPYGMRATRLFVGWAARAGCVVVSGAAIGCDQAAHRAALDNGSRTIAVLAGGPDVAYPRAAGDLLDRVAHCGAVVSEYPWGTQPQRWMFRARNRIIAGLSASVLVLEAALGSGTFSTADFALESGRDVLAIPGSIFAPECAGANRLIRQGATPITDVSELRDALDWLAADTGAANECATSSATSLSDDPLLRALLADPMRPDDVARDLGIDIVAVSRRIGILEAAGLVSRYRDGRYGPG